MRRGSGGPKQAWIGIVVWALLVVPVAGADLLPAGPGVRLAAGAGDGLVWEDRSEDGAQSWVQGRSIAVSPEGQRLYVTGRAAGEAIVTTAYEASTGLVLWRARFPEAGGACHTCASPFAGVANALAPAGDRLYVTAGVAFDYVTIAYDAVLGTERWHASHDGPWPGNGPDSPFDIIVHPSGLGVFVTGHSLVGGDPSAEVTTIAYRADDGVEMWRATHGAHSPATGAALAVHPGGHVLFVAAETPDEQLIAYQATRGIKLWGVGNAQHSGRAVATSPSGDLVYMAGSGRDGSGNTFFVRAVGSKDGSVLWERHDSAGNPPGDGAVALVVDPKGERVFATGTTHRVRYNPDWHTIAFHARTGEVLWKQTLAGPHENGYEVARAIAISPDGARVYVTGEITERTPSHDSNGNLGTVAYDAATGDVLWQRTWGTEEDLLDRPRTIAVAPEGERVYVTGDVARLPDNIFSDWDLITLAYEP